MQNVGAWRMLAECSTSYDHMMWVTWTSMLKGYAMNGQGKESLKQFEQMCKEGV
jgi:pentatricopeptide repeat protein